MEGKLVVVTVLLLIECLVAFPQGKKGYDEIRQPSTLKRNLPKSRMKSLMQAGQIPGDRKMLQESIVGPSYLQNGIPTATSSPWSKQNRKTKRPSTPITDPTAARIQAYRGIRRVEIWKETAVSSSLQDGIPKAAPYAVSKDFPKSRQPYSLKTYPTELTLSGKSFSVGERQRSSEFVVSHRSLPQGSPNTTSPVIPKGIKTTGPSALLRGTQTAAPSVLSQGFPTAELPAKPKRSQTAAPSTLPEETTRETFATVNHGIPITDFSEMAKW